MPEAGTYTAYFRAVGVNGSTDSFFAPSDFNSDPTIIENTSNNGTYEWETGEQFTITAADVGVTQELRIGRREGFNRLDAIVLHQDGNLSDSELDDFFPSDDEPVLLGDVNQDEAVTFADIPAFISVLISGNYQLEADVDENGVVDFADIPAFVNALLAQ